MIITDFSELFYLSWTPVIWTWLFRIPIILNSRPFLLDLRFVFQSLFYHQLFRTPALELYFSIPLWVRNSRVLLYMMDVTCTLHKGYYMPVRRYEFYLRVFDLISHSFAVLTHEKSCWTQEDEFISTSGLVMFCLLCKHQWKRRDLLCNHNDGDLYTCEDNNNYFHLWRYEVFTWKLTWYFTGVYLINSCL